MHKSTRFEYRKHPCYEVPHNRDETRYLNKIHRTAAKKIIKEGLSESKGVM